MPCFEFSNENQNLDLYIDDTVTSKNIKANTEKIDKKKHTTDNNSIDHTNIENTNSESDKKEKTKTPEKETTMKTEKQLSGSITATPLASAIRISTPSRPLVYFR